MIKTKSIFEPPETSDGKRILITYTWPKNLMSDSIDSWIKELGHPWELVNNWPKARISPLEFKEEYLKILAQPSNQYFLQTLAKQANEQSITLLCTCKIADQCHRTILKDWLEGNL